MNDAKRAELTKRYEDAMHGMQAGVALDETHDPDNMKPKHLRVGINAAMSDGAALARMLVAKGMITEQEYLTAIAEGAEMEHATYEAKYAARFGRPVKLVRGHARSRLSVACAT